MKYEATTERVLAEIRNARIERACTMGPDECHRSGTGDEQMLAGNAAWKLVLFESASEGGVSWRAIVNYHAALASVCPPLSLSLRSGLVKLAAAVVAWIEAIDREAL